MDHTQVRVDIVAHRRPQLLLIRRAPFIDLGSTINTARLQRAIRE